MARLFAKILVLSGVSTSLWGCVRSPPPLKKIERLLQQHQVESALAYCAELRERGLLRDSDRVYERCAGLAFPRLSMTSSSEAELGQFARDWAGTQASEQGMNEIWRRVQSRNTREGYLAFRQQFPEARQVPQALTLEQELAYQQIQKISEGRDGSPEVWDALLVAYPNHPRAEDIRSMREADRDYRRFRSEVMGVGDLESLAVWIDTNPQHWGWVFVQRLHEETWYQKLQSQEKSSPGRSNGWKEFFLAYPEGEHSMEAVVRFTLATETEPPAQASWERFQYAEGIDGTHGVPFGYYYIGMELGNRGQVGWMQFTCTGGPLHSTECEGLVAFDCGRLDGYIHFSKRPEGVDAPSDSDLVLRTLDHFCEPKSERGPRVQSVESSASHRRWAGTWAYRDSLLKYRAEYELELASQATRTGPVSYQGVYVVKQSDHAPWDPNAMDQWIDRIWCIASRERVVNEVYELILEPDECPVLQRVGDRCSMNFRPVDCP